MEKTRLHTCIEERKGQATLGNSTWQTGMAGLFAHLFVLDFMPFFTIGKIRYMFHFYAVIKVNCTF